MNSFSLLASKVKIRKCPSYFSGFFTSPEWHLCSVGQCSQFYNWNDSASYLGFNGEDVA